MLKNFLLLIIIVFMLIFSACDRIIENEPTLTKFQKSMLEDYEYMWNILRDNYPLWGVVKRRGIDVDKVYENNKKQISNIENEIDFYNLINNTVSNFFNIGHLNLLQYDYFKKYQYLYKDTREDEKYKVINDIFFDPEVEKAYEIIRIAKGKTEIDYEKYDLNLGESRDKNIQYYDLVENEVAYIKINSFGNEYIDYDSIILENIYKKIKNYEHIVFDISDNSGGNMMYWLNNIVKHSIGPNNVINYSNYFLLKKGEYNEGFINANNVYYDELRPVSELPFFENINKDDFNIVPYFYKSATTINIKNDSDAAPYLYDNTGMHFKIEQKNLNGRIWLITSGNTYSAADNFANFCKETNFATLIGQTTGGDGFGVGMSFLKLPNSKFVIRYRSSFGLNFDGSNNVEFGTSPDHYINGNMKNANFIDNCLKIINDSQ